MRHRGTTHVPAARSCGPRCALTSVHGGFGFTCGVEWLAAEKIRVHDCAGLNWDSRDNLIPELAQLNKLLAGHPCFFDGAKLTRLSAPDSPVYALLRESAEGKDSVLVLVNTEVEQENAVAVVQSELRTLNPPIDQLGQSPPRSKVSDGKTTFTLGPGAAFCLASGGKPIGLSGDPYRHDQSRDGR